MVSLRAESRRDREWLYAALVLDALSRASVIVVSLDTLWVLPQPSHDGAKVDVRNYPERRRVRMRVFRYREGISRQRGVQSMFELKNRDGQSEMVSLRWSV
jgi:hypothetical protein